jgi:hypothetical protein
MGPPNVEEPRERGGGSATWLDGDRETGPTRSAVGGGGTSLISKPKSPYFAHAKRGITASLTRVISRSAYTESVRVFGTVVAL